MSEKVVMGRTATSYEDFFADDLEPRIWKTTEVHSGVPVFHSRPPCGHHGVLSELHEVEENADGTFTIQPHESNSNSILCACGWHGYVYSNEWREL